MKEYTVTFRVQCIARDARSAAYMFKELAERADAAEARSRTADNRRSRHDSYGGDTVDRTFRKIEIV